MPLDPARLRSLAVPPRIVAYTDRDVMLYALSVGMAADGAEEALRFCTEDGLAVMPSFATIPAFDDGWLADAGIDLGSVVHGALDLAFAAPLDPAGTAEARFAVTGLGDKGAGRGGLVHQEIALVQGGVLRCTVGSTLFVRGGGGFGGSIGTEPPVPAVPERAPDATAEVPTRPDQALLHRLLGDRNPLHSSPAVARAAGFERPILHGACTFGIACATVIARFCDWRAEPLARFAARFAGPLYPGETLRFAFWHDGGHIAFRAFAAGREAIVLDNGLAELR